MCGAVAAVPARLRNLWSRGQPKVDSAAKPGTKSQYPIPAREAAVGALMLGWSTALLVAV
jgi:hypothetical protein